MVTEADPARVRAGLNFTVNWAFIDDEAPTPRAFVYEVYDRHLRLIYVGITNRFAARWSAHLSTSWWARSVDIRCVILTGYPTRSDARKVEALLIDWHKPPCNTKPERLHLRAAMMTPPAREALTAELRPAREF